MKIGLIDVDGHKFPNFALMKIANYHRLQGDTIDRVNHLERYDKVYQSKVFTFTPDVSTIVQTNESIKGGTGYKMYNELFCDDTEPDYSLYPQYEHAYGFLTRGCVRHCPWCIVPKKEGEIRPYRDIEAVLQGRKTAVLMDNNVLASAHGVKNYRIFVYLLVKDVDDANKRCKILKKLGVNPFAQTYRDCDNNITSTDEQKRFAWYVNQKAVFKATEWEEYFSSPLALQ